VFNDPSKNSLHYVSKLTWPWETFPSRRAARTSSAREKKERKKGPCSTGLHNWVGLRHLRGVPDGRESLRQGKPGWSPGPELHRRLRRLQRKSDLILFLLSGPGRDREEGLRRTCLPPYAGQESLSLSTILQAAVKGERHRQRRGEKGFCPTSCRGSAGGKKGSRPEFPLDLGKKERPAIWRGSTILSIPFQDRKTPHPLLVRKGNWGLLSSSS